MLFLLLLAGLVGLGFVGLGLDFRLGLGACGLGLRLGAGLYSRPFLRGGAGFSRRSASALPSALWAFLTMA